jgi:hypothetical protein
VAITHKVLGMVAGWFTEGARAGLDRPSTEALIRGVAEKVRLRPSFPADAAVEYFQPAILEALGKAGAARVPAPDTS